MPLTLPPEITIVSFSIVGVLTSYVWNDQTKRIKNLENHTLQCGIPKIKSHLAVIETDIKWIKQNLKK